MYCLYLAQFAFCPPYHNYKPLLCISRVAWQSSPVKKDIMSDKTRIVPLGTYFSHFYLINTYVLFLIKFSWFSFSGIYLYRSTFWNVIKQNFEVPSFLFVYMEQLFRQNTYKKVTGSWDEIRTFTFQTETDFFSNVQEIYTCCSNERITMLICLSNNLTNRFVSGDCKKSNLCIGSTVVKSV